MLFQALQIKPWLQMGTGRSGDISTQSLATTLSEWLLIRGGTWFQTPAQTKPQGVGLSKAGPFWHLLLIYYVCASTRHMSQSGHPCFCLTASGCFVVPFLREIGMRWSGLSWSEPFCSCLLRTFNTVVWKCLSYTPVDSNVRNELRIFINCGNYKKVLETDSLEFIFRKYHSP